MRILVTGGAGAVGQYLVRELESRGHEVWVADLYHSPRRRYVRCDVREFRQVEALIMGAYGDNRYLDSKPGEFEVVYHLAAEFGRWNGEDYYENLWTTNVVGTKHILRMQEALGFRAVYFSSSEVYGDYQGVMSEGVMDTVAIRQMNDYAMTKRVNEMQVQNSADMYGTESVRVRLFNTYGPGETYSPYRSVICMFCYHALHDMPFKVYRGHWRTSTFITDMASSLATIAERFVPHAVYNLAGTSYHTIEEVADLVIRETGCDPGLAEYCDAEPYTTVKKEVVCGKAIRDLGHDPKVALADGIRETVQWMREYYGK